MPAWLFVVGGLLLVVSVLLAVDWLVAGHTRHQLVRGRDQSSGNVNVGYALIERQGRSMESQGGSFT